MDKQTINAGLRAMFKDIYGREPVPFNRAWDIVDRMGEIIGNAGGGMPSLEIVALAIAVAENVDREADFLTNQIDETVEGTEMRRGESR